MLMGLPCQHDVAEQVGVKAVVPHRTVGIETLVGVGRRGVDDKIDSPELRYGRLNDMVDIGIAAQIGRNEMTL